MKIVYTSRRPFFDGPVKTPFPENDPANIAYVLSGDYFSFFTTNKLQASQLEAKLAPYDVIFVPLDLRDLQSVEHIVNASNGRYILYSEGGVADYQMLSPTKQITYLQLIRNAKAIMLYYEKFIPFYQQITDKPVLYFPYPFFKDIALSYRVPLAERANRVSLPSGLTGATRNGLGSILAARELVNQNLVNEIDCWLAPPTFNEDANAVKHILLDKSFNAHVSSSGRNLRQILVNTRIDYRPLLKLRDKIKPPTITAEIPTIQQEHVTFLRRQNWLTYLKRVSHSRLVLDLNNRPTVGRNSLDCAILEVPCLSTSYSDMQEKLFPQITVDTSWDTPEVMRLSRLLLEDSGFYSEVTKEASHNLQQFLPDAFKARFEKLLVEFPEIWKWSSH